MASGDERRTMRPFVRLASFEQARDVAMDLGAPLTDIESLPLVEGARRIIARPAVATTDVPSADRAAMDGYALRTADGVGGATLLVTGRIAAGQPPRGVVEPGTCIEIATGAPIPAGTETVVPVERTEREGDRIRVTSGVAGGEHISRQASDLERGRAVAEPGNDLNPARLSACAAAGIETVDVVRRPRVLIAPTGDEVVPLGTPLKAGQVYDSNAAGLQALLSEAGAYVERAGIVLDEAAALDELLQRGSYDLVVTIGGTSVGRRDLVPDVMGRVGEVLVHGVAVKPGKPLLLGRAYDRAVVGLPGFPTTCMMLGYALLEPMIRRMGHRPVTRRSVPCALTDSVRSPAEKVQLLPVAVDCALARPTFTFSAAISSMADANGWIEIPHGQTEVPANTTVEVQLF